MYKYGNIKDAKPGDIVEAIGNDDNTVGGKLYAIHEGSNNGSIGHFISTHGGKTDGINLEDRYWKLVITKPGSEAKAGDTVIVVANKGSEADIGSIHTVTGTTIHCVLTAGTNGNHTDFLVLCTENTQSKLLPIGTKVKAKATTLDGSVYNGTTYWSNYLKGDTTIVEIHTKEHTSYRLVNGFWVGVDAVCADEQEMLATETKIKVGDTITIIGDSRNLGHTIGVTATVVTIFMDGTVELDNSVYCINTHDIKVLCQEVGTSINLEYTYCNYSRKAYDAYKSAGYRPSHFFNKHDSDSDYILRTDGVTCYSNYISIFENRNDYNKYREVELVNGTFKYIEESKSPTTSNGIQKGMRVRYIGPTSLSRPSECTVHSVDIQYDAIYYKEGLSCSAKYWEAISTLKPEGLVKAINQMENLGTKTVLPLMPLFSIDDIGIRTNLTQQKGNNMQDHITIKIKKSDIVNCNETVCTKPKTALECKLPYAMVVYSVSGSYEGIFYNKTKKGVFKRKQKYLQLPVNLGKTVTVHKSFGEFTTNIPVIEVT